MEIRCQRVAHDARLGTTVDLAKLIARRRAGRSLQDLADASGMAKQTWAKHANPPDGSGRRMPEAETILAIARGLNVNPRTVGLAVLETMGVIEGDPARPELLDLLPPDETLARLTPDDVDTVVRLVALLASRATERAAGRSRRVDDPAVSAPEPHGPPVRPVRGAQRGASATVPLPADALASAGA